jgi:hypothetical protein
MPVAHSLEKKPVRLCLTWNMYWLKFIISKLRVARSNSVSILFIFLFNYSLITHPPFCHIGIDTGPGYYLYSQKHRSFYPYFTKLQTMTMNLEEDDYCLLTCAERSHFSSEFSSPQPTLPDLSFDDEGRMRRMKRLTL